MTSGRQWPRSLAVAVIAVLSAATFACSDRRRAATHPTERTSPVSNRFDRLGPVAETQPVPHGDDAADDPAIWVDSKHPSRSAIIGTDKQGGLAVYDLSGRQLQYLADGELNNVDIRPGFPLGGRRVALVAASNRDDDTIALYHVDVGTRRLAVAGGPIRAGIAVYGLCMYRSRRTARFYAFVDSKEGEVEQWELLSRGRRLGARRVRTFDVGGQVEGCVADDELGHLYVSEEEVGIWRYHAEPGAGTDHTRVDSTGDDGHLTADVEGLAIAHAPRGRGFLIASSQGNSRFIVYSRRGNAYVDTFEIAAGSGIDGVQDTDGIDVTTANLGGRFSRGLLVAQDGSNDRGNQNFKLVPWG